MGLILDKEKHRQIVEQLSVLLIVAESDFRVLPLTVNVKGNNLEGITPSGYSVKLRANDEIKEMLEKENISVTACITRKNEDDISYLIAADDLLEEAIYKVKYMCVESFIEFKNITSMKQLKLEKEKLEKIFREKSKLFENWRYQDKINWGIKALDRTAKCPNCKGDLTNVCNNIESDDGKFEVAIFKCTECFENYIVVTDKTGKVVNVAKIHEEQLDHILDAEKEKGKTKSLLSKAKNLLSKINKRN